MHLPLKWEFPGGKIEQGENAKACLKRELFEELGVDIKILEALPPTTHSYSEKSVQLLPFRCNIIGGEIVLREHKQVVWLPLEKLENLDWAEADIPIVKHYTKNYR